MLQPLHVFIGSCLLIFGGLYYYASEQDEQYSARAEIYLEDTLMEISRWQPQVLRKHLAPAAREVVGDEQLQAVVAEYESLGRFERLQKKPQFSTLTAALSVFGGGKRLGYSFPAQFEHGEALVTATLQVEDGRFSLYNFSIREQ